MSMHSLGHISAPASFENDLSLLDRYHAFSAEMLRISLLALSGIGALIFKIVFSSTDELQSPLVKWGIIVSATLLGFSAAAALLHRYCSSDSMACQLRILRLELVERPAADERRRRTLMLKLSAFNIGVAAISLALGGLSFIVSIGALLF